MHARTADHRVVMLGKPASPSTMTCCCQNVSWIPVHQGPLSNPGVAASSAAGWRAWCGWGGGGGWFGRGAAAAGSLIPRPAGALLFRTLLGRQGVEKGKKIFWIKKGYERELKTFGTARSGRSDSSRPRACSTVTTRRSTSCGGSCSRRAARWSISGTTARWTTWSRAAIEEDAHGIAVSSYQGGHVEYFGYLMELSASAAPRTTDQGLRRWRRRDRPGRDRPAPLDRGADLLAARTASGWAWPP